MKWSWKLGRIAGIDVHIHATFLLLLAWIGIVHWMETRTAAGTLAGVAFVLLVFACVLAHEYGHALMARRFGIPTRDITLLPIGGLARIERMPSDPRQELWIALAGPAVNVVVAGALTAWLIATGGRGPAGISVAEGPLTTRLLAINVVLVVFNMIPAFPMDGGRVLRAILAMRWGTARATQTAATVGQGLALVFGIAGLFINPMLVFVALFVWIGATQEAGAVQMRSALSGVPIGRAMVTDFRVLAPFDPLSRAADLLLAGAQQEFPVVDQGRVVGVLTRADLVTGLAESGAAQPVADRMRRQFETADLADPLESIFERVQACECHTVPVVSAGRLVGLLTMENLGEFVMLQSALEAGRRRV